MDCVDLWNFTGVNHGYGWILNIVDCYSKFVYSYKLNNKTASAGPSYIEYAVRCDGA